MRRGSSKAEVIEYRGHRYRLYPNGGKTHRRYFSGSEPRSGFLHRHIWEDEKGPIPPGYEIHHKDENTLNNNISNLECITKKEHRNKHLLTGKALERQREHMARIRKKANEWHKTDEGREANRQAALLSWGPDRPMFKKRCLCCEQEFESPFERTQFCPKTIRRGCRSRYRARGPDKLNPQSHGGRCQCSICRPG
jgi:HNH endonuclease